MPAARRSARQAHWAIPLAGARVILDTHVLLWMDRDDPKRGPAARRLIEAAWQAGRLAVSEISFWEVSIVAERGRIVLPVPVARRRYPAGG